MNNDEFDYGHNQHISNNLCCNCELSLNNKKICNNCPYNNFKDDKR